MQHDTVGQTNDFGKDRTGFHPSLAINGNVTFEGHLTALSITIEMTDCLP